MCEFKVGDEVTPIDPESFDLNGLAEYGRVYTVSKIWINARGRPVMWFAELRRRRMFEHAYRPCAFRKVQRRSSETGMAILKSICDNPDMVIVEDA